MALNPTATAIADGQLGNAKATLYTAAAKVIIPRDGIVLVNTDSGAHTVNIYVNRTGVSRRVTAKDYSLNAGAATSLSVLIVLESGDLLEGDADAASKVDYTVSGAVES